jgi:hypothetical protein
LRQGGKDGVSGETPRVAEEKEARKQAEEEGWSGQQWDSARPGSAPDELKSWLREPRQAATHELLRVDAHDRSLIVHLIDGALLLEERPRIARVTPI